jgi:hypothetical protein
MAYSVFSINDFVLPGTALTENPNQLDTIYFTDFLQAVGPSTTSPAQGGVYYFTSSNGGSMSGNNVTSDFTSYGITACSGLVQLSTGTTNNNTGVATIYGPINQIPGIQTPSAGLISKYEIEVGIRTPATLFDANGMGVFRLGFMNATSGQPADGMYFERVYNTTVIPNVTDTNLFLTFRKDGTEERVDTGVAFSANTTYRLYACFERDSSGNYLTTYNIKNYTTGTTSTSTTNPSNTARYPSGTADVIGPVFMWTKIGTATTSARTILIDYIGVRIRRPLDREILIYS